MPFAKHSDVLLAPLHLFKKLLVNAMLVCIDEKISGVPDGSPRHRCEGFHRVTHPPDFFQPPDFL
jgi:hypothetical protein